MSFTTISNEGPNDISFQLKSNSTGSSGYVDMANTIDGNRAIIGIDSSTLLSAPGRAVVASMNNIPVDICVYGSSNPNYVARVDTDRYLKLENGAYISSTSAVIQLGGDTHKIYRSSNNVIVAAAGGIVLDTSAGGILTINTSNRVDVVPNASNACALALKPQTTGYGAYFDAHNTVSGNRVVLGVDGTNYTGGANRGFIASWNNIPLDFGVCGSDSNLYTMRLATDRSVYFENTITMNSASSSVTFGASTHRVYRSSDDMIVTAPGDVKLESTSGGDVVLKPGVGGLLDMNINYATLTPGPLQSGVIRIQPPTAGYGAFLDITNTGSSNRLVLGVDGTFFNGVQDRVFMGSWNSIPVDFGVNASSSSAYSLRITTARDIKLSIGSMTDSTSGYYFIGSSSHGMTRDGNDTIIRSTNGEVRLEPLTAGDVSVSLPGISTFAVKSNGFTALTVQTPSLPAGSVATAITYHGSLRPGVEGRIIIPTTLPLQPVGGNIAISELIDGYQFRYYADSQWMRALKGNPGDIYHGMSSSSATVYPVVASAISVVKKVSGVFSVTSSVLSNGFTAPEVMIQNPLTVRYFRPFSINTVYISFNISIIYHNVNEYWMYHARLKDPLAILAATDMRIFDYSGVMKNGSDFDDGTEFHISVIATGY